MTSPATDMNNAVQKMFSTDLSAFAGLLDLKRNTRNRQYKANTCLGSRVTPAQYSVSITAANQVSIMDTHKGTF